MLRSWRDRSEAEALSLLERQGSLPNDDVGRAYERLVSETSAAFTLLVDRLNVLEPMHLFRLIDEPAATFLREVSRFLAVAVVRPRLAAQLLEFDTTDSSFFEFVSFALMARGFLLDRYLLTKDLAPESPQTLPALDVLTNRWYDAVLTNDNWLDEWSSAFARDLVDAQWAALEEQVTQEFRGDNTKKPLVIPVFRVSLLQGMVARQFLAAAAPRRSP